MEGGRTQFSGFDFLTLSRFQVNGENSVLVGVCQVQGVPSAGDSPWLFQGFGFSPEYKGGELALLYMKSFEFGVEGVNHDQRTVVEYFDGEWMLEECRVQGPIAVPEIKETRSHQGFCMAIGNTQSTNGGGFTVREIEPFLVHA